MSSSSLEEFISKNKETANNILKCGGCQNILFHCGDYEIVKIGKGRGRKSEEGIICETCRKYERAPLFVTRITDNHVFQVPMSAIVFENNDNNLTTTAKSMEPIINNEKEEDNDADNGRIPKEEEEESKAEEE